MAKPPKIDPQPADAAASAIAEALAPSADPPPPPKVWRSIAFARRSVSVYLGGSIVKVLGGEWIEEPDRVEHLRRDPSFAIFDFGSPAEFAEVRADYDQACTELRERAANLGLTVFRDGEAALLKR